MKAANAHYSKQARQAHPDLAPTKNGKLAMAAYNAAFFGYAVGRTLENDAQQLRDHTAANWQDQSSNRMAAVHKARRLDKMAKIARGTGHLAAGVGLLYYGARAVGDYRRLARS